MVDCVHIPKFRNVQGMAGSRIQNLETRRMDKSAFDEGVLGKMIPNIPTRLLTLLCLIENKMKKKNIIQSEWDVEVISSCVVFGGVGRVETLMVLHKRSWNFLASSSDFSISFAEAYFQEETAELWSLILVMIILTNSGHRRIISAVCSTDHPVHPKSDPPFLTFGVA